MLRPYDKNTYWLPLPGWFCMMYLLYSSPVTLHLSLCSLRLGFRTLYSLRLACRCYPQSSLSSWNYRVDLFSSSNPILHQGTGVTVINEMFFDNHLSKMYLSEDRDLWMFSCWWLCSQFYDILFSNSIVGILVFHSNSMLKHHNHLLFLTNHVNQLYNVGCGVVS